MKGTLRITGIGGQTGEFIKNFLDKMDTIEKQNSELLKQNEDLKLLFEELKKQPALASKETIWQKIKKLLKTKVF